MTSARPRTTTWLGAALAALGLAFLALAALAPIAGAATVPGGFEISTVKSGLSYPMAIRFAPAPSDDVFVAEKSGIVKAFDGLGDATPTQVVDLRTEVHDYHDRGLLGLAVDPNFALNRAIYVLYARDAQIGGTPSRWGDRCDDPPGGTTDGCVIGGSLLRLTLDSFDQVESTTVLIENEWCQQMNSHSVGALGFGPDGYLYASAGDGASYNTEDHGQLGGTRPNTTSPVVPRNPCGDPPNEGGALRSQDVRSGGDPTGLSGAVIRVDPSTGAPAPGNPGGSDANAQRIVAHGFRNPFRWAFRPGTRELWVGDVGWSTWEEIDRIPDAADATRENFGWPCYEGAGRQGGYDGDDLPLCESLYNQGAGAVSGPHYAYRHGQPVQSGDGCATNNGSAVSAIAFAPASFGTSWQGSLLFGDYARGCVWALRASGGGVPADSGPEWFVKDVTPVDMTVGPDGALYVLDIYGSVLRVRSSAANQRPTARISSGPRTGAPPLTVSFDGRGSSDPEGGALTYAWDLDGDGSFADSTSPAPSRTYATAGQFTVGLRVTDPGGESDTTTVEVLTAANTPPAPSIDSAAVAWKVGDRIDFAGSARDAEEGTIPAARLHWDVTLEHCASGGGCHSHFLETADGAAGSVTAIDHGSPSYIRLKLTATDAGGLKTSVTQRLDPDLVTLRVEANVPGLTVRLNGEDGVGGIERRVIRGSLNSAYAGGPQSFGGERYGFVVWSNGATTPAQQLTADEDTTLTAGYVRLPEDTMPPAGGGAPPPGPGPGPGPGGTGTAPDRRPPLLLLSGTASRQGLERGRVYVRAGCGAEPCTLSASGTLSVGGASRARGLKGAKRALAAGQVGRLDLRLDRRTLAGVRRALRRGRRVRAVVSVTARDAAGNRATAKRTISLRLRTPAAVRRPGG